MKSTPEGSIEWYFRRLAVMSPIEVAHRVREQFRREVSKRQQHGWESFDLADGPLQTLGPLRTLSENLWPDAVVAQVEEAACSSHVAFLGQPWPEGIEYGRTPGLWFTDPVTKMRWPGAEAFCFDIKWRGDSKIGDIKLVAEINRLQFLQPLCAHAIRTCDAAKARKAADVVLNWMKENPPYCGINWTSMIELSLRLVSVAFVIAALEATNTTGHYRRRLRQFVAAHAYWLNRFPSLFSSANNHLVAEGLGLLVAADLVPDLPDAECYRRSGRSILIDSAFSQFHEDGVGVEQSPTYSAFTLEMILLGMELGRASGSSFPAEAENRIASAAAFLKLLLDEAGRPPRIGDDDEGRVLACPPLHEDRYVASVLAAAAGVTRRPELAPPARSAHLRDVIFQTPAAPGASARGIFSFRTGGYTIIREYVAGRKLLVVFDHGPLGFAPLAAHGHADALSLWLHLDDQPVLVDAGTYRYHASEGWRTTLRSTCSHNSLEIAGASQSTIAGPFNWLHKASGCLASLSLEQDWEITAEHDGYKDRFGCTHRRRITRSGNSLAIMDQLLDATEELPATISFLVHPELSVDRTPGGLFIKRGEAPLLRLSASSGNVEVVPPDTLGERNSYSARYGLLEPATRIIYHPHIIRAPHVVSIEVLETVCNPGDYASSNAQKQFSE